MSTRELEHPGIDDVRLTDVLSALSDPARLAIVRRLAEGALSSLTCHEIEPEMPKSTRSHHLKTLREAGVIRSEPNGRERRLSLRREELDRRFPGLLDAVVRSGD